MSSATTTASDERSLPFRMRGDLVASRVMFGERTYWNVKDPVSLRYHQLREEEYFILRSLDGKTTFGQLQRDFENTFAPLRLGEPHFQSYVRSLHSLGLILVEAVGQGETLLRRRDLRQRQQWLTSLLSILAIRFRGIDPDRALTWLYPRCRWVFSWWGAIAAMCLVVTAAVVVIVDRESLWRQLPSLSEFFSVGNLLWIVVAVACAKVLHELGHALTCKHFGGECHEMGFMLLVFTPCMYCNVSDAWLLPSKWQRMVISAAGICVELVLAALCILLWKASEPGLLNTVFLNTAILCSVNSLFFNGNPLLRYDGYYVLADLVEVPNLRQRASDMVARTFSSWCLGVRLTNDRKLPGRARVWLLAYGVAAFVYRLTIIGGILWMLHRVLKPHGLEILAQLATAVLVTSMVLGVGRSLLRFVQRVAKEKTVKSMRLAMTVMLVTILIGLAFTAPLPKYVVAPVVIEPAGARKVFVSVDGRVPRETAGERRAAGDRVHSGETLVALENPKLVREAVEISGRIKVLQRRIESLKSLRLTSTEAGDRLPAAQETLRTLQDQLAQRRLRIEQLAIKSPIDGVVMPAARRSEKQHPQELATWTQTPLHITNAGSTLESGATYCLIGDPSDLEAIVLVEQSEIAAVQVGQAAEIWLREYPGCTLAARVVEVTASPVEVVPEILVTQASIPVTNQDGVVRPTSPSYQVRLAIDSTDIDLPLRCAGWAKVRVDSQSVAKRVYRYLASTFRFM